MDIKQLLKPHNLAWVIVGALFLVFLVVFVITWVEYGDVQKYMGRMRDKTYDVSDLNKYKRELNTTQFRLEDLRRKIRINFEQSQLIRRILDMARAAGIDDNDLAVVKRKTRRRGELEELELELTVTARFAPLGKFLARLEHDISSPDEPQFEYVIRIRHVDVAVRKRTGATLRAKLYCTAFRKAGG